MLRKLDSVLKDKVQTLFSLVALLVFAWDWLVATLFKNFGTFKKQQSPLSKNEHIFKRGEQFWLPFLFSE